MTFLVYYFLRIFYKNSFVDILESEVIPRVILQKHAVKKFVPVELIGRLALLLADDMSATL
jgi:hypothetical protein